VGIGRERQTGKTVLAEACCGFAGNPRQSNANAGRLKIETQRHLHNPRIVDYGADLAERGGATTQVHAWIGEIYVVDQVICFGAEGEIPALRHLEALHQRSVDVEEARAPEPVAPGTAEGACNRLREVRDLGGRDLINARSNAVVSGDHAADVARTGIVGPARQRKQYERI
jgi:hypothetical protein